MHRAPFDSYGVEQGQTPLREAIQQRLYSKVGRTASEIFVSDGSKCDIGRLQLMFGADVSVACQVCARAGVWEGADLCVCLGGFGGVGGGWVKGGILGGAGVGG